MNLFSTLRAAHYLASDILPALRRLVTPPTEDGDPYAERQARLHADALAERESATEVLEPQSDCGLGEADECLCDPDGGLSCDTCSSIGDIGAEELAEQLGVESIFRPSEMGFTPPSAADEPAFTAWLASIDERLAVVQNLLTSAAPGLVTPDAAPESPAPPVPEAGAGQPDLPWCAAEMRQVADILLATDSPFALGYANDLRAAANEISATERN